MSVQIKGVGTIGGLDQGLVVSGVSTFAGLIDSNSGINVSGSLVATNGILLDDSIVHDGDTNTKIRFPAADTITAETSGGERLRITSTGKVGIGSTNPTSLLTVGASPNAARSSHPTALISPTSGNASLMLRGNSPTIDFDSTAGGIAQICTDNADLIVSAGTFENTALNSGELIRITADGQVRIADANQGLRMGVNAANYKISRDPTGTDAGLLKFYGNQSGYTGYIFSGVNGERLRIDSSGFIKQKFTSNNSTTAEGLFINNLNNGTGNNASLILSNDSGERKKAAIALIDTGSYGAGDLVFALDGADSGELHLTNDEKLRITSDGYVTKPAHPCFDASRTAGAVSSTAVIVYNDASLNNGNHYNTSNGRFTAPVAGIYQFWFGAIKQDTHGVVRLHMRKNGSGSYLANNRQLRLDSQDTSSNTDGKYGENGAVTLLVSLAKDDYVEVLVTSGTVYGTGSDYTYFCGTLIG